MATPRKKGDVPFSVKLPKEVRVALRGAAKRNDLTSSQLVRKILVAWFDFHKLNKGDLTNGEESQEGKEDGPKKVGEEKGQEVT